MAIFQGVIFLSFGVGLLLVSNRDIGTDATTRLAYDIEPGATACLIHTPYIYLRDEVQARSG